MPAAHVLEPVLKMKVDELFLNWLSETATQGMLKEYLQKVKNEEWVVPGARNVTEGSRSVPSGHSNATSTKSLTDRSTAPLNAPSSPPSTTLPTGNTGNSRTGLNGRLSRRSVSTKKQTQVKKAEPVTPVLSESIPRFYFPRGRPIANLNIDTLISRIEKIFSQFPNERASIEDMGMVAKACECPLYWKVPLFLSAGGDRTGFVSVHKFVAMWRKILQTCHDDASKFVHLLAKPGCNYLEQEDFIPFLQDVVNSHTGLAFLKEASEFHTRYITTVVQRIFYNVNRSWNGRITCSELRKSTFLQNVALLEDEQDINQLTEYFSYEHFYVIYCKFWEIDADHDLHIDPRDLARHNDQGWFGCVLHCSITAAAVLYTCHNWGGVFTFGFSLTAISQKMIKRIFSGTVTRDKKVRKEGRMSYADFVWFLISEEDKTSPTSIEYWFRCMDLDGDGVLSMYELEYFYEEQRQRLDARAIEPLPFEDCLCQMLDLVKPESEGKITLHDLKRCKMSSIFFDTFFNIEKYLEHEQRDPLSVARDSETEGQDISDWERYAAEEYDILVTEETANEQYNDGYENDFDPAEHHIASELGLWTEKRHLFGIPSPHCDIDFEYEDDFE